MTAPANTAELKRLAEAAIRMASDGWKMMPDVPTEAMTEALERSESYCDSCHGTAFSGWSGYEALFKAAPSEAITPSVVLSLISTIERQAEEIAGLRELLQRWSETRSEMSGPNTLEDATRQALSHSKTKEGT